MSQGKNQGTAAAKAIMRDRYMTVWPVILKPWTDYLIAARKAFDGDMDRMVVLAVIGLATLERFREVAPGAMPTGYGEIEDPGQSSVYSRPINIESIALFSGIPRETVRRKVNLLVAKGWVSRDDKGILVATPQSAGDLAALSDQLFALIGVIYGTLKERLDGG